MPALETLRLLFFFFYINKGPRTKQSWYLLILILTPGPTTQGDVWYQSAWMKQLFDIWTLAEEEEQTKWIQEGLQEDEVHWSSIASWGYLVSGWLRVTEAQVSDEPASLCPPASSETRCRDKDVFRVKNSAYVALCWSATGRTSWLVMESTIHLVEKAGLLNYTAVCI